MVVVPSLLEDQEGALTLCGSGSREKRGGFEPQTYRNTERKPYCTNIETTVSFITSLLVYWSTDLLDKDLLGGLSARTLLRNTHTQTSI